MKEEDDSLGRDVKNEKQNQHQCFIIKHKQHKEQIVSVRDVIKTGPLALDWLALFDVQKNAKQQQQISLRRDVERQ